MPTTENSLELGAIGDRAIDREDLVCLGCGCLCDDIAVVVESGRVVEARRACRIGESWFRADRDERLGATIEDRPVETTLALDRAAEILGAARRPLVLGLAGCSIEAQGAAVALADRLGAAIDPGISRDQGPPLRAFQRLGRASATLGEVRNRADVVVFWGVDPVETHPRHLERYSAEPIGRFLLNGRSDRTLIVVDRDRTATAQKADVFVRIDPDRQLEAIWQLRAIVGQVENLPKSIDSTLVDLADRLLRARYAAIFFGAGLGRGSGGSARVEALFSLVRDLNARTRCVGLPIGSPGNAAGASTVLAWRSGFASPVDFHRGFATSIPGLADADSLLARGEADAALIVADDPRIWLSPAAIESLGRIPVVEIGPDATVPGRGWSVGLGSARLGIESAGTVLRADGVSLPIRPPLSSDLPTDLELLTAIAARLSIVGAGTS